MQDKNYRIRTMNRKEVDFAIEWAAKEGWNPGIHDADWHVCLSQGITTPERPAPDDSILRNGLPLRRQTSGRITPPRFSFHTTSKARQPYKL